MTVTVRFLVVSTEQSPGEKKIRVITLTQDQVGNNRDIGFQRKFIELLHRLHRHGLAVLLVYTFLRPEKHNFFW